MIFTWSCLGPGSYPVASTVPTGIGILVFQIKTTSKKAYREDKAADARFIAAKKKQHLTTSYFKIKGYSGPATLLVGPEQLVPVFELRKK